VDRVLNIARNIGDERRELIFIEGVGDCPAVLALAAVGRLLELGFKFRLATTTTHIGDGDEGAGLRLGAERAMGGRSLNSVVPENRVHVDCSSRPTVAGVGGNGRLLIGDLIALWGGGHQVSCLVGTGTEALTVLDSLVAGVITHTCKLLDLEG